MDQEVARIYGEKVRIRACGLCWRDNRLLMVNHHGITPTNFWAPPGGGVEFGESIADTIKKEFWEETGLRVEPGMFRFGCEYIEHPIHSIEVFYDVKWISGQVRTGHDPELQIIENVRFVEWSDIMKMPRHEVHGIFRQTSTPETLMALSGFYRI